MSHVTQAHAYNELMTGIQTACDRATDEALGCALSR